jgi:hypothetical protein
MVRKLVVCNQISLRANENNKDKITL